ncbi:hypothetical protein [Kitasatospora sp. NPDC002040]|uniref:hypothetical protein n=1 Tax=Kitasatospora sp. NPDC002040 TaxID=3154661 RepID=UPI00332AFFEC
MTGPKPITVRAEKSAIAGYVGLSEEQRRRFKDCAAGIERDRELGKPYHGDVNRRMVSVPGDELDPAFDLMYVIGQDAEGKDEARIVFVFPTLRSY